MTMSEVPVVCNVQTNINPAEDMNELEQVVDFPYFEDGKYTGSVIRGARVPHGRGRMDYNESDDALFYDGEFTHGHMHGYGCLTFRSFDSYIGQFVFDQREGKGLYQWNDGRMYEGDFKDDNRHGKGTFTWPDGASYVGDFVEGQRTGQGTYHFADGSVYEGSWKDGKYEGYGIFTWKDGRSYTGEWKNGQQHGLGVETAADGSVKHDGMWYDHKPLKESRSSQCDDKITRSKPRACKRVSQGEIPAMSALMENGIDALKRSSACPTEATASTILLDQDSLTSVSYEADADQIDSLCNEYLASQSSLREIFPTNADIRNFFPDQASLREFFPSDEAFREAFPTTESLSAIYSTTDSTSTAVSSEHDSAPNTPSHDASPVAQRPTIGRLHGNCQHAPASRPQLTRSSRLSLTDLRSDADATSTSRSSNARRRQSSPLVSAPVLDSDSLQFQRLLPGDRCNCMNACFCFGRVQPGIRQTS